MSQREEWPSLADQQTNGACERRGRAGVFASHGPEFESGLGIDWSSVSEIERALQPRTRRAVLW